MKRPVAMYCSTCQRFRSIVDWHERNESLSIELEPCGHVVTRTCRLEWSTSHRKAA